MLSQHFCQLLAAAALPNCAATLDKMSAASFDRDWGEYETSEKPRTCFGLSGHIAPSNLSKTQSRLFPLIADVRRGWAKKKWPRKSSPQMRRRDWLLMTLLSAVFD